MHDLQAEGAPRVSVRRQRKAEPVTLSEEDGIRYLHFGTEWIQGGMRVARPFALELEYQRQMMAVGLFLPEPRRIVQLGLGAAALTKFCWREVPSASVVAVELSARCHRCCARMVLLAAR